MASVLDQGYPNLEYIVVDGGSSDDSLVAIKERQDELAFWCSEPDEGHYDAVSKGFEHASGDIMGYLNADDILLPGSLMLIGSIFAAFPEVDWITGMHSSISERGIPLQVHSPIRWSKWHLLSPRVGRHLPQESTFWREGLWVEAKGINPAYKVAGDFDLWTRFADITPPVTLSAPIGAFRHVKDQRSVRFSHAYDEEVYLTRLAAHQRLGVSQTVSRLLSASFLLTRERSSIRARLDSFLGAPRVIEVSPEGFRWRSDESLTMKIGRRVTDRSMNTQITPLADEEPGRRDFLIFVHIPKTAGTTLKEVVRQQEGWPAATILNRSSELTEQEFRSWPDRKKVHLKVIQGHFAYGLHTALPGKSSYITMLREPRARLVSSYVFARRNPNHVLHRTITGENLNFSEFLQRFVAADTQLRLVIGGREGILGPTDLAEGVEMLRRCYAVVGVTERFDESVLVMAKTLGWSLPVYGKRRNVTERAQPDPSPEEDDLIRSLTRYDRELYKAANEILDERIRVYGSEWEEDLQRLRSENERLSRR